MFSQLSNKIILNYVMDGTSLKNWPIFFQVRPSQSVSIFLNLNHPCSCLVYYFLFGVFYLSQLLFWGFLQFESNFVHQNNDLKYCDIARMNNDKMFIDRVLGHLHGPGCSRSVHHDLEPNIFPSGPTTYMYDQSLSTRNYTVHTFLKHSGNALSINLLQFSSASARPEEYNIHSGSELMNC